MEDELDTLVTEVGMGKPDDRQLRLSCVSLAVEAVNHDPERDVDAVIPLAQKMYEWVKNG